MSRGQPKPSPGEANLRLFSTIRAHRHVLKNFIGRDLKVKYRGTVFGYLWSLLEPLSLVLVYLFLFGVIIDRDLPAYPLVVAIGVLSYNFMSGIMNGGAAALVANAGLIRRVYLPREVFIFATVGTNTVVFALNMVAIIPLFFVYSIVPSWRVVWFFVAAGLLAVFSTGAALFLACANAVFRDVGYVVRVVLRLAFYGTPAIYPVSMITNPEFQNLYMYNPLAVYISMARSAIMDRPMFFSPIQGVWAAAFAFAVLLAGAAVFFRWERTAVKFL